jgi:proteasome activator subunit 4
LQALKKLANFVHNNALPGAAPEIGLLCSFAVLRDPKEGSSQLLKPIMDSLVSSLSDFPTTGFGGSPAKDYSSKVRGCLIALKFHVQFTIKISSF